MPPGVSAQVTPSGVLKTEPFQLPKTLKTTKKVGAFIRLVLTMLVTLLPAIASPVAMELSSPVASFSPVSARTSRFFSRLAELSVEIFMPDADPNGEKKLEKKSKLGKIRSPFQLPKLLKARSR